MYVHVLLLVSGTDCTQIKTLSPRATSGVYVIQPARVRSPFKVWKHLNIYARYYIIWLHSHTGAVKLSYGMLKVSPGLPELLKFYRVPFLDRFCSQKTISWFKSTLMLYTGVLWDAGGRRLDSLSKAHRGRGSFQQEVGSVQTRLWASTE